MRTDMTDMTKVLVSFQNFANAPKMEQFIIYSITSKYHNNNNLISRRKKYTTHTLQYKSTGREVRNEELVTLGLKRSM